MATFFRNSVQQSVGIAPVTLVQTGPNNSYTIIGLNVANVCQSLVEVSITFTDSAGVTGYFLKSVQIPPNTSLKAITNGEKLILAEQCGLRIVSNTASSIDVVVSYAEIV